jgi:hypothetical protein
MLAWRYHDENIFLCWPPKTIRLGAVDQKRRGLKFSFTAAAEIAPESSPSASVNARVTEISPLGCYLEIPAPFEAGTPVLVKIFRAAEYFEAKATVSQVQPTSAMGLAFREVKPNFRAILQKWILAAMHNQTKPEE